MPELVSCPKCRHYLHNTSDKNITEHVCRFPEEEAFNCLTGRIEPIYGQRGCQYKNVAGRCDDYKPIPQPK